MRIASSCAYTVLLLCVPVKACVPGHGPVDTTRREMAKFVQSGATAMGANLQQKQYHAARHVIGRDQLTFTFRAQMPQTGKFAPFALPPTSRCEADLRGNAHCRGVRAPDRNGEAPNICEHIFTLTYAMEWPPNCEEHRPIATSRATANAQ